MAEVALRNVFKSYDNVVAVSNISLDIPNHEFVVLVGPSFALLYSLSQRGRLGEPGVR